ncbi:hypothetical protein EVAR_81096_1 [Eumeta japonica]|uniref:Uncharacterized protein n=1 Tax=Eumeta variegata TaxID=151549 RepID=A0A4C1T6K9_EUMVA|nr:hypothetical protein EVAR_81096_1 [Eumeta japonica]
MISGVVTLFSSKVRLFVKNGPMKLFHIAVGLFSLSLGLITMTLGFHMDYFKAGQESLATALMTFVVMILMYLLIQPIVDLVSTTRSVM